VTWTVRFVSAVLLVVYGALVVPSTLKSVQTARSGRDYATYHYAVAEALDGGDPYDTKALGERAREDAARHSVHPFFYPPPYLLTMLWAGGLSLGQGYLIFFWANQLLLLLLGVVFYLWFRAPPLVLAVLLASYTPIPDNASMGQANLGVLLLAAVGLWLSRGEWVSAAAMMKMSPALYLVQWASQRRWKPVLAAVLWAVLLSLIALPLVGFRHQLRFYLEVLPGFSTGEYHGLTVPISIPLNYSIPFLFNQVWPGPSEHALSSSARFGSAATSVALLAVLAWLARIRRDSLGTAAMAGAFTVLMLVSPVHTYEHHLVMLLLPLAAVGTAWVRGGVFPRWSWPLLVAVYFFLAWPLAWLRWSEKRCPDLAWWATESKFFAAIGLALLCLWVVHRSPGQLRDDF
jgi:hypothetical protein